MPQSADFVMHWWDHAAHLLTAPGTRLRRFGFVTTNSITQTFSRRVIEGYLAPPSPGRAEAGTLSLVYAIADHPWTKVTRDAAAVRIAMTVAQAGSHDGRLVEVVREAALDTDTPEIEFGTVQGRINADLTAGTDVGALVSLRANDGLGYRGVQLIGAGFIVTPAQAVRLGSARVPASTRTSAAIATAAT